ncbi:hypothetical protein BDN72DRAFT_959006 [Pluteus cervinus]|uniref:Uncharacterized protein n=1 Tax=Pluteus cervinus TaxID=181527 RepID=A0ACD3AX75_9AGAR|nr:hypothetical protein BDN72DRAFT_959006 [Pluteus cervinus]
MPRTSCRTRRDRLVIAPAGGWQDGGIGAVQASFTLSSRVATTLRSMAHAGKYRPCFIVSRRRHRQVYLMGTLEGKSRLMVDQFTQDLMIPIAPTHVKGSFQLVVNPPGLEMPCWVNGLLKAGFDKLSGYWTSQTESTGEVKYQAEKSQVDDFLLACAEQQERFRALSEQNPQLKTDMIRQFLVGALQ